MLERFEMDRMTTARQPDLLPRIQPSRFLTKLLLLIVSVLFLAYAAAILPLPFVIGGIVGIIALMALCLVLPKFDFGLYCFVLILLLFTYGAEKGNIFWYLTNANLAGIPSYLELAFALMVALFFVRAYFGIARVSLRRADLLYPIVLCLIVLAYLVGMDASWNKDNLTEDGKSFLYPAIAFFIFINSLDSENKIRFLLTFGFVVTSVKSVLGSVYYLLGNGIPYGRDRIVLQESFDHFAIVAALVTLVSLAIHGKLSKKHLILGGLGASPMIFSLVFSYRRHAWLGLLLSLFILFLFTTGARKMKIAIGAVILLVVCAWLVSLAGLLGPLPGLDFMTKRIASIVDPNQSSNVAHMNEWRVTFEDITESPILGLGLGSEHRPVPKEPTINTSTVHNAFLMLWMKMGLPAVLLFLGLLVAYIYYAARAAIRNPASHLRPLQVGLFSSCGFWAISLNVGPTWYYQQETCAMVLAAVIVIRLSGMMNAEQGLNTEPGHA